MTRKDFKVIARIIANIGDPWSRNETIGNTIIELKNLYPRFDGDRFASFVNELTEEKKKIERVYIFPHDEQRPGGWS